MGLFSSKKTQQTTNNIKRDQTLTFGGAASGAFVTGNENSPISIQSVDSDVIKTGLEFAKDSLSKTAATLTTGSKNALDTVSSGFQTALQAAKSSDERLSGEVFKSVNIGLVVLGLVGVALYLRKK
jgi:hypothetical protein